MAAFFTEQCISPPLFPDMKSHEVIQTVH